MLREGSGPAFLASGGLSSGGAGPSPSPPREAPQTSDGNRDRLLAALGPAPIDIDELGRATGLAARAIQVALLELTLAGRVERHGHQLVSRKE
jgi:DNA processing protein